MAQYIRFLVGGQQWLVGIEELHRIIKKLPIVAVPNSPDGMIGVINLRDEIIPVLDSANLLKVASGEWNKLLIVKHNEHLVALTTEDVLDIVVINEKMKPSPVSGNLIRGILTRENDALPVVDVIQLANSIRGENYCLDF